MDKDIPYSNREIDIMTKVITDHLGKQDVTLERIEAQTLKTNGRVNKHDLYFKFLWWFIGVLGTLIVVGLPTLRHIVNQDIQNTTDKAVDQAFNSRFSKVELVQ